MFVDPSLNGVMWWVAPLSTIQLNSLSSVVTFNAVGVYVVSWVGKKKH